MTDRTFTAAVDSELDSSIIRPVLFVKVHFDSADGGTQFFWNGLGFLDWNGDTYTGTGLLGTITPIAETVAKKAVGAKLTLSGIPSGNISLALDTNYQERLVEIYLGFFDSIMALIADPFLLYSGRIDIMEISEGGETASISVNVENRLIDLERPKVRYYTDEDQKNEFSGDKGLEFVVPLNDGREIVWKEKSP